MQISILSTFQVILYIEYVKAGVDCTTMITRAAITSYHFFQYIHKHFSDKHHSP